MNNSLGPKTNLITPGDDGIDMEGESIVRNILVAYEIDENRESLRYAKALFDTGCPENLMSKRLAAMLGYCDEHREVGDVSLVSLTGERYLSLGTLRGRWAFRNDTCFVEDIRIWEPVQYMAAIFYVSNNDDDPFDVVIGFKTIKEQKLLQLGEKLVAGFRRAPPLIDKTLAKHDQIVADAKREANAKAKEARQQQEENEKWKRKSGTTS